MKNFDNLKLPELLEEIVRMRAETEAIKKQGNEAHIQRLAEIDAIRKEAELIRKETEAVEKRGKEELLALENKGKEELLALKKETEALEKRGKEELLALKKETEALEKRGKEELLTLKKESEKADRQLKSTMDRLGFNVGKGVETMFCNSIENNPKLHNIHFDFVNSHVKLFNESGATAAEIDMVLVNKNSVGLLETKHRFRPEDLEKFLNHSHPMFKKYGGSMQRTNTYLFIAALSYDDEVIALAKTKGVGVLYLKNDFVEVEGNLISY
ncbi:MAG: hypothetical protein QM539_06770 [Alphaproteobacteria bacterium]|nr:hypothetical protein [Alphaproteobacteria bacterium]